MNVCEIDSKVAMRMVMDNHYSQRKVGSKFSFGLFTDDFRLVGCCVYSIPASHTLCKGVCGESYKHLVLELSRLVVIPNSGIAYAASILVGSSLRALANLGSWVLVSYADCNSHVGHVGYVYQATNWIYTGQGTAEPKWLHPVTKDVISYTRRHIDKKAEAIGLNWRDLIQEKQLGKHRYCTFAGGKIFKRDASRALRYSKQEYPKGDTRRHVIIKHDDDKTLFDCNA